MFTTYNLYQDIILTFHGEYQPRQSNQKHYYIISSFSSLRSFIFIFYELQLTPNNYSFAARIMVIINYSISFETFVIDCYWVSINDINLFQTASQPTHPNSHTPTQMYYSKKAYGLAMLESHPWWYNTPKI